MMEKQNVVQADRTPEQELKREDADWDKQAAAQFTKEEAPTKCKCKSCDCKEGV